jgi:hypothetical protein
MRYLQDFYYDELDKIFIDIELNINCKITAAKKIIDNINNILEDMYVWLRSFTFENIESEIYFFKHQKPRIISKLIFYYQRIEIETNLPTGKAALKKYLVTKIQYYNSHNQKNIGFFQYYRGKKNVYDDHFFVRQYTSKKIYISDNYMLHYDNLINTKHDFSMAQIIAYDLTINYIEQMLEKMKKKSVSTISVNKPSLNWTGNKIELIELVYALYHNSSINNGKTDIKEIASKFGEFLNIEIDEHIYRNFIDIKNRKIETTKFLNILSQTLSRKISEQD